MIVDLRKINKTYVHGKLEVPVLFDIDLTVDAGEYVSIMGPSGSGKSTLMNIIGCLDEPTSGTYILNGTDVSGLSDAKLSALRNRTIGFVFQNFNLLPRESALENVALPMLYAGIGAKERHRRAKEALVRMGLEERLNHEPSQLSGGQQQRVAIARGIVNKAPILMADEPTGNLDSKTSDEIMRLFQKLNDDEGITIILVTHEPDVAAFAKRQQLFRDGLILEDKPVEKRRF